MDANIQNNNEPQQTRICKCCGKELPITEFNHYRKNSIRWICKSYEKDDIPANPKFVNCSSRELVLELRARGYRGKLTKTITKNLVI
jgi:hypothetical protein